MISFSPKLRQLLGCPNFLLLPKWDTPKAPVPCTHMYTYNLTAVLRFLGLNPMH